jgi:hypothetical protein
MAGQNWKQVDSCMYLQSVAEKTLLEANGKLQTQNWHHKNCSWWKSCYCILWHAAGSI